MKTSTTPWLNLAIILTLSALVVKEVTSKPMEDSVQKLQKLDQLKAKVWDKISEEKLKNDFYLMKFLAFKEFDVDEATDLLIENLEWRRDNNMSTILTEDFSDVKNEYWFYFDTVDKVGRPIVVINMGSWDIRKAAVTGKLERINRVAALFMETASMAVLEAQEAGKKHIDSAIFLMDLDGMNTVQQLCSDCMPWWLNMMGMTNDRFPRTFHELIFINAQNAFVRLVSAVKPLASKDFIDRFIPFEDRKRWMEYLDERIDKEQRYANFGGTKAYPQ